MGQIEAALVCYQKSALLMARGLGANVTNTAYSRTWIGELLAGREELGLACAFLQTAMRLWQQVGPPKTSAVMGLIKDIETQAAHPIRIKDSEAEKMCMDLDTWEIGRRVRCKSIRRVGGVSFLMPHPDRAADSAISLSPRIKKGQREIRDDSAERPRSPTRIQAGLVCSGRSGSGYYRRLSSQE
jgi:hypothetical protein